MECPYHGENCQGFHSIQTIGKEQSVENKIIQIVSHNKKLVGLTNNGKLIELDYLLEDNKKGDSDEKN